MGHYAAGARLIGLSEKQMAKHWATLNITGDKSINSPYAQPVCLFTPGTFPRLVQGQAKSNGRIKLTITKRATGVSKPSEVESPLLQAQVHMILLTSEICELYILYVYMFTQTQATVREKPAQPRTGAKHRSKTRCICNSPGSTKPHWAGTLVTLPAVNIHKTTLTIEDLPLIRKQVRRSSSS